MKTAPIYYIKIKQSGLLSTAFRIIFYAVRLPLIIPHIFLLLTTHQKDKIYSDTGTFKNTIRSLVFLKHYRNLFYYRIGNISKLISWILPPEKSIVIHGSMPIGPHAHFVHNIGCHLNAQSIGRDFVCYQHVVLGAKNLFSSKEIPIIGDNVTLCTGAVVVGNVTIGNNVVVGANTLVCKDIPDNATVIGKPAIIQKLDGKKVSIPL